MIGLEHYLTVAATLFVIGILDQMMRNPAKAMELQTIKPGLGW